MVIGETQSELKAIFVDKAWSLKADISFADKEINQALPCSLLPCKQQAGQGLLHHQRAAAGRLGVCCVSASSCCTGRKGDGCGADGATLQVPTADGLN